MNEISVRKGPELNYILDEYRVEFENKVVEAYSRQIEKNQMKLELPNVIDDMFLYVLLQKPEHFVSAYLGHKHNHPDYFFEATQGMTEREKYLFVKETSDAYNQNIPPKYDDLLLYDLISVLDFHHISHVDIGADTSMTNIPRQPFYKFIPMTQVW